MGMPYQNRNSATAGIYCIVSYRIVWDGQLLQNSRPEFTSLRWSWQTSATQCLTPTKLYTNVSGHCGKLVTDDGHQFTTLIVHLSN